MMEWRAVIAVAAGAALGGVLRYLAGAWTVARFGLHQGWLATGVINVSGSLVIGVVAELALQGTISPVMRLFLATGILGGYTTFSTYALEVASGAPGSSIATALYTVGSVALSVAAALGGSQLARLALR